jgi:hypothetical protein
LPIMFQTWNVRGVCHAPHFCYYVGTHITTPMEP